VRLSIGIESADDLIADLRQALDAAARTRPAVHSSLSTPHSPLDRTDLVLLGAGAIGRELIEQITDCDSGKSLRICGVIDRSGHVVDRDGIPAGTLAELAAHKKSGRSLSAHAFGVAAEPEQSVEVVTATAGLVNPILVDLTASETSPLLDVALGRGFDLVLANKVPLASDQQAIDDLFVSATVSGRRILSEAT